MDIIVFLVMVLVIGGTVTASNLLGVSSRMSLLMAFAAFCVTATVVGALIAPPDIEKLKKKKDIKALIKALRYNLYLNDYQSREQVATTRQSAARALGEIGDPQAVWPLVATLRGAPDAGREATALRVAAAEALGEIGDIRAVDALVTVLKHVSRNIGPHTSEKDVCRAAAEALGKIGDSRAVGPLVAALDDPSPDVTQAVVEALVRIDDPAIESLVAELKEDRSRARLLTAGVLDQLGWKPERGEDELWYWVAKCNWEKASDLGPIALEPLVAALKRNEIRVAEALDKLGWEPDGGENEAWYWIAKRKWEKAAALGNPAVQPLIATLKDANSGESRSAAARALGWIGDPQAVDPLIAALENPWSAQEAIVALGNIGDPRAVERLIHVLQGEFYPLHWEDKHLRHVAPRKYDLIRKAAVALGWIGDPRAVAPLIAALKDGKALRRDAAMALVKMYNNEALDEQCKQSILSVRGVITTPHCDMSGECARRDHEDRGIGVDFPL